MTTLTDPAEPIEAIRSNSDEDENFVELLTESLLKANAIAKKELDNDLYNALAWPLNLPSYIDYLIEFSRWIPRQSSDKAWIKPGTDEFQEVYDRLCHFYWLIDQKVGPDENIIIENIPWFSEWLVAYADVWGNFLNTTKSFNDETLESFIKDSPKYEVENSMIKGKPNAPSGWLTFNQFFARELNPGLRTVQKPADNSYVTCPADCTFKAEYDIRPDSTIPEITVKKTHKFASIQNLLEGSQFKDAFAGGKFVHYFLGPYSYHRFHTPVAGKVVECYPVRGLVYLDVKLSGKQFDAPDSSQGGYEFAQSRGIVTIDTKDSEFGDIGIVAIIPVGMCQVSSVKMTATQGSDLLKGDEFGYFLFGGSDIIVLFQAEAQAKIDADPKSYRHYGSLIARCFQK